MESRKFALWFIVAFLFVVVVLSFVFVRFSAIGMQKGALAALWSVLILLFLLLGIIVISLYVKYAKEKGSKK